MRGRAAPDGYRVGRTRTLMSFLSLTAAFIALIACGLLSSMAIITISGFKIYCRISIPVTISSVFSCIRRSSQVRYGSHSHPFIIRTFTLPFADEIFAWAGNPAPPMPTIPASRIFLISSSGSRLRKSSVFLSSHHSSLPSGSITTARSLNPDGWQAL